MKIAHESRVLVSYVHLAEAGEEEYGQLYAKLPFEEQSRASRYHLLKDRLAFAAGRALTRSLLTQLNTAPAQGWTFVFDARGKPQLPPGLAPLEFNISHSASMVAAVAAVRRPVGIDVESLDYYLPILDVARDRFAASELALLMSLPEDRRRETFFSLWTLREAYAKARGHGISDELLEVVFTLDPPGIRSTSKAAKLTESWTFRLLRPAQGHILTVAVSKQVCEADPGISIFCTELGDLL